MKKLAILLATCFSLPAFAAGSSAENLKLSPLWEIGLGGGGTFTPDYPGSDQNHLWAIPFPFAVYRGEILHSDRRGGTRARFFHSAGYEFNFSAAGGLPSSSDKNYAREGMPNLEWLGEFGPRLMVDLYSLPERSLLRLGLPLRFAFSTDGRRLKDRGYTLAPEILYDLPHIFGSRFDVFTLLTVNFADRRFNSYFYEVEPSYQKQGRSEYKASPGYLLTDLSFGLITNVSSLDMKLATYLTIDSLQWAANKTSPLFKQTTNYTMSMVLIWVFAKSSDKVESND